MAKKQTFLTKMSCGYHPCQAYKKDGKLCSNKGKYLIDGNYFCGIHSRSAASDQQGIFSFRREEDPAIQAIKMIASLLLSENCALIPQEKRKTYPTHLFTSLLDQARDTRTMMDLSDLDRTAEGLFVRALLRRFVDGARSNDTYPVSATFLLSLMMICQTRPEAKDIDAIRKYLYSKAVALGYERPPFVRDLEKNYPTKGVIGSAVIEEVKFAEEMIKAPEETLVSVVGAILISQAQLLSSSV